MRAVNDSTAGGPIVLFDLDDTLMAHRATITTTNTITRTGISTATTRITVTK